jgi:hypothetical protein
MDELVMYAATTTFPLAYVDNKHFRVSTLDRYLKL